MTAYLCPSPLHLDLGHRHPQLQYWAAPESLCLRVYKNGEGEVDSILNKAQPSANDLNLSAFSVEKHNEDGRGGQYPQEMAQPSDKFGGKLPQVPCPLVESFWVHPTSSVQQD